MKRLGYILVVLLAVPAFAAGTQSNEPVQVSSDKLDVYQNEHKAIFTGNVIAVQGTTKLRSAEMVVFYRDSGSKAEDASAAPAVVEPAAAVQPEGIYRIEAYRDVVFTTPTEIATGDVGIYNVDTDTIDLTGPNVTLTRGQNILKGTAVTYNMTTGRSVLTAAPTGGKPPRVHGLFVPKSDEKPAAKP